MYVFYQTNIQMKFYNRKNIMSNTYSTFRRINYSLQKDSLYITFEQENLLF